MLISFYFDSNSFSYLGSVVFLFDTSTAWNGEHELVNLLKMDNDAELKPLQLQLHK